MLQLSAQCGRQSRLPLLPVQPMRLNESEISPLATSVAEQSRLVFERMNRILGRISKSTAPEAVRRFRTTSRRVETLVSQLSAQTGNKEKLLKLVSKLRKRAGKLRDVDVQIALLKNLKIPDRQNHRTQLLQALAQEHARRTRRLSKAVSPDVVRELRKRLRREQDQLKYGGVDPLQLASASLPQPSQSSLTEKTLHASRIAARSARYLAELAGEEPQAKLFVEELTRAQDAIGEWHDTVKLREKAEKRFGSAADSALVSALQNIGRARFRSAGNALAVALAAVSQQRQSATPLPAAEHKRASSEAAAHRAAVA